MKLKMLFLAGCFGLLSSAYAAEHSHSYPQANGDAAEKSSLKSGVTSPGYCGIEIVNRTYRGVFVEGRFDDGTPLSFVVDAFDAPHVIHLDYYDRRFGYSFCHSGMNITIEDYRGDIIYSGYTLEGTTLNVVPYLNSQAKIEVKKK